MTAHRCAATSCGRFVRAQGETCTRHSAARAGSALDMEIEAMRRILRESLKDITEPEMRAKLIPRIVSVSIQAIRTDHQLGNQGNSELMALLEAIAPELERTTS